MEATVNNYCHWCICLLEIIENIQKRIEARSKNNLSRHPSKEITSISSNDENMMAGSSYREIA